MPGLLKRKAEKMIIDTALKGLKARAESLARRRTRHGRHQVTDEQQVVGQ